MTKEGLDCQPSGHNTNPWELGQSLNREDVEHLLVCGRPGSSLPKINKQKINRVDSLEIGTAAHSHLNNRGPSL